MDITVILILLFSIAIMVTGLYFTKDKSKVETQKKQNQNRHQELREKVIVQFKEIAKERNKIIQGMNDITLPDSLYNAKLFSINIDQIDSNFTSDLVKIKSYIDEQRAQFSDLKIEYINTEIYNVSNINSEKNIPLQHQIKMKDGRIVGVNVQSVISEAERFHDYLLFKQKTLVSLEMLGLILLDLAVNRSNLQYHINRDILEKMGVFKTASEREIINTLVTISDKIDHLTSALQIQSSMILQAFDQIESNISQIEHSLQSIQSSSKAQNLLIMYNIYETRKIRKSLI